MASFDDLLSALCGEFTPQHASDFQKIFLIHDAKEARLAFDVLVAYGFDAKVYPDPEKTSKLYITQPAMDARAEQKLEQALAYARGLRGIKENLDALATEPALASPDYTMTFANAPGNNKQINIVLTQAAASAIAASATRPAQAASPAPVAKRKPASGKKEEGFSTGPTLGQRYYPGALDEKAQAKQASLKRQIMLYLTGNAATGGTMVMLAIVIVAITFTLFILAKSFLCPDFATVKKNLAWYCQQADE
jgi:hypothetical protein